LKSKGQTEGVENDIKPTILRWMTIGNRKDRRDLGI
jgi:hypothetical protein